MLENLELYKSIIDFLAEKPLECIGEKKESWVILAKLMNHPEHKNSRTVQYFEKNIYPIIKERLSEFEREINSVQTTPQILPEEIEKALL